MSISRLRTAWSLGGLALLLGCSTSARPPLAPRAEPGTLTLRLRNDVRPPFRVDSVAVAVDGATYVNRARPPSRMTLALRGVPSGLHTVQMQVQGSFPCGFGDEPRERVRLRQYWSFRTGPAAAGLGIALVSRGIPQGFGESLRFDARLDGGTAFAEESALPPMDFGPCEPLAEPAGAACRIEVRRAAAIRARDVVWASCLDDKLVSVRALEHGSEASVAQRRAHDLERQAEECIGFDLPAAWTGAETRVETCPALPFEDDGEPAAYMAGRER